MSMSSCWLITWFILCSGGFVYHFASGPCFFDVCARFNQLLLKHWWKLCQACEGRLLYLENNSRWGTAGFSELGCFYLFIYFGCLKDASKAPRNGLTFLSFCILNPHLSDCHIFPAKEKLRESAVGGFVLLQMEEDNLFQLGRFGPRSSLLVSRLCVSSSKVLSWFEPLLNIVLSPLIVPVLWPNLPCVISPVMWLMFSLLGWGVVLQLADCYSGSTQPSLWAAVNQWNNLVPQISLALRMAAHCCNLLTRWVCSHLLVRVVC